MKKIIFTIFLIMSVCTAFGFSQTKKRPVRRPVKRTTVTKTITERKFGKYRVIRKNIMTTPTSNAVTTDSGLTYIITQNGTGAQLKAGDTIIVNYTGLLTNGQKFDSSLDRGEPFSFPLGAGRVIKGWDEGFQKLRIGDHAILTIPPSIGYGTRGAGRDIPPGATLIFIVEVLGVK